MSVAALQTKAAAAKKAYKANKEDKSLKAAYKAVKAELEAAEAAAKAAAASKKRKAESSDSDSSDSEEQPAKKAKTVSIDDLKAAADAAKKAYKANKEDKSLKVAYKEAKKAVEEAEAAQASATAAAPAAEAAPVEDALAGLKKNKPAAAAASFAHTDKPPTEKLFCGNLSWDITDELITEFFKDCGKPNDIHWLSDRESGRFKGCGFVTFDSVEIATKAMALNGTEVMGRPIKLDFATPRPGGSNFKKNNKRELSAKPEGCTTVFAGNLDHGIDEDTMRDFAKDCGEIASIRWLTDRETGDFKGCGFIEFSSPDSVDAFVALNGTSLLGRDIRLDYAKARG